MFWLENPTDRQKELYEAVMRAHGASAHRKNCSTLGLLNAYAGSGDYVQAIIGALATLGGKHAPLLETYRILISNSTTEGIGPFVGKIEGWGNSFEKGHPDPIWSAVEECLDAFPIGARIRYITEALHAAGKLVYPNPSAYTAAAAIVLNMPPEIMPFLFIGGRLASWSQLILSQNLNGKEG